MRECLDCGVLLVPGFEEKIQNFINSTNQSTPKLNLYPVCLTEPALLSAEPIGSVYIEGELYPDPSVLSTLELRLQRFDIILLPVVQASLVWTRLLLQQTRTSRFRPLVALTKEIHPVAMFDLVCLGVSDIVFDPYQTEELRIRLLMLLRNEQHKHVPNPRAAPVLQDRSIETCCSVKSGKPYLPLIESEVCCKKIMNHNYSFKEAKAIIVNQFESTYLTNALNKYAGNIARSAKMSGKHRRAFWALMQKHGIKAEQFKDMS